MAKRSEVKARTKVRKTQRYLSDSLKEIPSGTSNLAPGHLRLLQWILDRSEKELPNMNRGLELPDGRVVYHDYRGYYVVGAGKR